MLSPDCRPHIRWTGALWKCQHITTTFAKSGWGNTPHLAYEDWVKKLRLDGLYGEFFA